MENDLVSISVNSYTLDALCVLKKCSLSRGAQRPFLSHCKVQQSASLSVTLIRVKLLHGGACTCTLGMKPHRRLHNIY